LSNPADRQDPATPADVAVRLDGVTKRFGEITALHEASLQVRRGELMTLLGPSGCGKTTLLNLVAGFFAPDSGEIAIDGARVTDLPTWRREIGMTFQNYALFPHMTVASNVGYGLRARRLAKPEIARRVAAVLELVKLSGLEDRKPRQLSGGQQQRVALARALVVRPKVLLLDEPFSALDRNLRASMQVELRDIQRKLGVTTIFVTHDQSEALSLSDRIAVISQGRIRQIGAPDDIYRRPVDRFVASFVGDVNVLRGRLERVDGATASVALGPLRVEVPSRTLDGVPAGAAVDLFVRPEDLSVAADGTAASPRRPIRAATSIFMSIRRTRRRGACWCACPAVERCRAGRSARASALRSRRTRRWRFRCRSDVGWVERSDTHQYQYC
jgi:putative spermidine/putrescine transport system ATP-binding protein/spermidine/putrescine transport system ATP-binding protein